MRKVHGDEIERLLNRYEAAKGKSVGELAKLKARRENDAWADKLIMRFGELVSELESLVETAESTTPEVSPNVPQESPNEERQREAV